MSALTAFPKAANGSIVTTTGAVVGFYCAIGVGASDTLCIEAAGWNASLWNTGTWDQPILSTGGSDNGTCLMDAYGKVKQSTTATIASYRSGLPLDVNGVLCTEVGAGATFVQGVGITAAGRVAIT